MAVTGVTGAGWRADVTPAGGVEPWDGSPPLRWCVAADDGWHDPARDTGVRHRRIDGTAVFETKVRVPGGDVVQRVWSVADGGGVTLVEVANESPLPIACAITRPDVLTTRPPSEVPVRGIELPPGTIVVPVGHRSTVTVGLRHRAPAPGALPVGLPGADAVARGWRTRADAASRLELPDATLVDRVRAARCEAALAGPGDAGADPARFLLALGELVRMGELDAAGCADDVAAAVAGLARRAADDGLAGPALDAAAAVLAAGGERRAVRDVGKIRRGAADVAIDLAALDGDDVAAVAAVERRVATGPVLFPAGIPTAWLGQNLEAHGLVAGPAARLSVALRWHGRNVAVLWELNGDPLTLTSGVDPSWRASAPAGEALWRLPAPIVE